MLIFAGLSDIIFSAEGGRFMPDVQTRLEVLIVEDDADACRALTDAIDVRHEDLYLAGVTDNSFNAIKMVKSCVPDIIILDLELHKGGGDGLMFLRELNTLELGRRPFIIITTNNVSEIIRSAARSLGADYIMTKSQEGYSADSVTDFLIAVKSTVLSRRPDGYTAGNNQSECNVSDRRYRNMIIDELNKIGVNPRNVGNSYIIEAILLILKGETQHLYVTIGKTFKKSESSVERAMQNAINRAWTVTEPSVLLENYKAYIKSDRGVPSITEFIYYYAQKIKSYI